MNSKKMVAKKAVELIKEGMTIGLGTGSTALLAIEKIGLRVKEGLQIKAVATSKNSENLAMQSGIPLIPFSEIAEIDIAIDGADEVDQQHNLIKGGGGALLREKIIAANSKRFIVIVDESKLVNELGRFPLPVEIVPFASNLTLKKLRELKCGARIRMANGENFITDNGNLIVDCDFEKIADPENLNIQIHLIPGVVETGLFMHTMVSLIIVGYEDGSIRLLS